MVDQLGVAAADADRQHPTRIRIINGDLKFGNVCEQCINHQCPFSGRLRMSSISSSASGRMSSRSFAAMRSATRSSCQ